MIEQEPSELETSVSDDNQQAELVDESETVLDASPEEAAADFIDTKVDISAEAGAAKTLELNSQYTKKD